MATIETPVGWRTPGEWWTAHADGIEWLGYDLFETDRGGVTVAEIQRDDEAGVFADDGEVYVWLFKTPQTPTDLLAIYLDGRPADVRCPLPTPLARLLEAEG